MLHFFLGYAALGWGICVAGIFAPSKATFELLGYVGGIDPAPLMADPMYDYWLRMASSVFTFIGVAYLLLAIWPKKYAAVLPFAGVFMLAEGIILLIHGLRLHLPETPFSGDTTARTPDGWITCLPATGFTTPRPSVMGFTTGP